MFVEIFIIPKEINYLKLKKLNSSFSGRKSFMKSYKYYYLANILINTKQYKKLSKYYVIFKNMKKIYIKMSIIF